METAKIKIIKEPVSLWYLKYTRFRQQAVLMLQHCAILSQLNRHQDALDTSKATALLIKDITQTASTVINLKQQNYKNLIEFQLAKEKMEELETEIIR